MNIWKQLLGILGELEESGLQSNSPEGEETLFKLLSVPVSGQFCKCGTGPLARFEVLNGNRCEECRTRDIARWAAIDAQKAVRTKLAR